MEGDNYTCYFRIASHWILSLAIPKGTASSVMWKFKKGIICILTLFYFYHCNKEDNLYSDNPIRSVTGLHVDSFLIVNKTASIFCRWFYSDIPDYKNNLLLLAQSQENDLICVQKIYCLEVVNIWNTWSIYCLMSIVNFSCKI